MLVLTRRPGERIVIGDNIEIVVRKMSGNRVTIAIKAPREVTILRGELQTKAETASSSKNGSEKEQADMPSKAALNGASSVVSTATQEHRVDSPAAALPKPTPKKPIPQPGRASTNNRKEVRSSSALQRGLSKFKSKKSQRENRSAEGSAHGILYGSM